MLACESVCVFVKGISSLRILKQIDVAKTDGLEHQSVEGIMVGRGASQLEAMECF